MSPSQIWNAVLGEFEVKLDAHLYKTWMKDTALSCFENGHVVICVSSGFNKEWLEKKYHTDIVKTLEKVSGQPIQKITYRVEPMKNGQFLTPTDAPAAQSVSYIPAAPPEKIEPKNPYGLNTRYTFDTFIVGKNNELAHAAARAVCQRPGTAYNPLFIYGGVGLGKTHLLHAIGNEMLKSRPDARVLYVPCEKFTNDFINAVRAGSARDFKNNYRNVDVLLIDDIQFISTKTETQEEFFHTFNDLHAGERQIILSSDRPPKEISTLEDRLRSRLEWGMIADINTPDLETRVAILQTKCREKSFELPPEVMNHIAAAVSENVRELEGALNKIIATCQLHNQKPSLETVKSIMTNIQQTTRRSVSPKEVIKVVCDFFDVTLMDIQGQSREKRFAHPRQIIMFLLRHDLGCSFPTIGAEIGGRDHTTAMHAHGKITIELERDAKLKQDLHTIKQVLYQKV